MNSMQISNGIIKCALFAYAAKVRFMLAGIPSHSQPLTLILDPSNSDSLHIFIHEMKANFSNRYTHTHKLIRPSTQKLHHTAIPAIHIH